MRLSSKTTVNPTFALHAAGQTKMIQLTTNKQICARSIRQERVKTGGNTLHRKEKLNKLLVFRENEPNLDARVIKAKPHCLKKVHKTK